MKLVHLVLDCLQIKLNWDRAVAGGKQRSKIVSEFDLSWGDTNPGLDPVILSLFRFGGLHTWPRCGKPVHGCFERYQAIGLTNEAPESGLH